MDAELRNAFARPRQAAAKKIINTGSTLNSFSYRFCSGVVEAYLNGPVTTHSVSRCSSGNLAALWFGNALRTV